MIKEKNVLTNEEYKKLLKKIDFDKLFDKLMTEYKSKNETKVMKMNLIRKEK